MFKQSIFRATAACVLALVTGLAAASGTDGGAGAETGDTAAYNTGKGVYANKLACSGCPMAGKTLNAEMARALLSKPNEAKLSAEESAALTVYLKRRFKL